jgi:Protein of unknown function (DUF3309)
VTKKRDSSKHRCVGTTVAFLCNMFLILFIVLLVALLGGGWGHPRYGYASWSPAGLVVLVLLLLWLTGSFNGHVGL